MDRRSERALAFRPFALSPGFSLDAGGVEVRAWQGDDAAWDAGGTVFGVVTAGSPRLRLDGDVFPLRPGTFFVAPEAGQVGGGSGLLIRAPGYRGLRQIGGPVERTGRLVYIDGCTDTLLVCPPRLGDPSLNHLHIPAGTVQSLHTHASDRIGVILKGTGLCRANGEFPLAAGLGWWIPAGLAHAFSTGAEALDVIAWHPDSVFGPTDEVHPMRSGTLLSAEPRRP